MLSLAQLRRRLAVAQRLLLVLTLFSLTATCMVFALCVREAQARPSLWRQWARSYAFSRSLLDLLVLALVRAALLSLTVLASKTPSPMPASLLCALSLAYGFAKVALFDRSTITPSSISAVILAACLILPVLESVAFWLLCRRIAAVHNAIANPVRRSSMTASLLLSAGDESAAPLYGSLGHRSAPAPTPAPTPAAWAVAPPRAAMPHEMSDVSSAENGGDCFGTPPEGAVVAGSTGAANAVSAGVATRQAARLAAAAMPLAARATPFDEAVVREACAAAASSPDYSASEIVAHFTQLLEATDWLPARTPGPPGLDRFYVRAKPFWLRADATAAASVARTAAAWCDDDARSLWDVSAAQTRRLATLDASLSVCWHEWLLPWPSSPRDFVVVRAKCLLRDGGAVVAFRSLPLSARLSPLAVRGTLVGGLLLRPLGDGATTRVSYALAPDLGAAAPQSLVASLQREQPLVLAQLLQYLAAGGGGGGGNDDDGGDGSSGAGYSAEIGAAREALRRLVRQTLWLPHSGSSRSGGPRASCVANVANSDTHELIRSEGVVPAPLARVRALLCDASRRRSWDEAVVAARELEAGEVPVCWVEWQLPWPASHRDTVFVQAVSRDAESSSGSGDGTGGDVTLVVQASLDRYAALPPRADVERAHMLAGFWLQEVGEESTRVVAVVSLALTGAPRKRRGGVVPDPFVVARLADALEGASA